jgi:hypothetical protein
LDAHVIDQVYAQITKHARFAVFLAAAEVGASSRMGIMAA